jgi:hypothetical protein
MFLYIRYRLKNTVETWTILSRNLFYPKTRLTDRIIVHIYHLAVRKMEANYFLTGLI